MRNQLPNKPVRSLSGVVAKLAISLSVFAFAVNPMLAQTAAEGTERADKNMVFDAVTIRPVAPNSTETWAAGSEGDHFFIRNLPLTPAITTAFYDNGKVPAGFVDSLPKWVREERYDLTAKISGSEYEALRRKTHESAAFIPMDMLHPMLQNMLKERAISLFTIRKRCCMNIRLEWEREESTPRK